MRKALLLKENYVSDFFYSLMFKQILPRKQTLRVPKFSFFI